MLQWAWGVATLKMWIGCIGKFPGCLFCFSPSKRCSIWSLNNSGIARQSCNVDVMACMDVDMLRCFRGESRVLEESSRPLVEQLGTF